MSSRVDIILVWVLLSDLALLGSSRLASCIRLAAGQGVVLALLPLVLGHQRSVPELLGLAAGVLALKGILFPKLLFRSLRSADVRRELAPVLGHTTSLVLGVLIVMLSFWLTRNLSLPREHGAVSGLVLPVAMATLLCGLLLIVSRRLALMQVVGYLVLENGVFIFGVALAPAEPMLVEMGILLDVFLAVLVMGIAVFHISRTFDHIDVEQLSQLRDWEARRP